MRGNNGRSPDSERQRFKRFPADGTRAWFICLRLNAVTRAAEQAAREHQRTWIALHVPTGRHKKSWYLFKRLIDRKNSLLHYSDLFLSF